MIEFISVTMASAGILLIIVFLSYYRDLTKMLEKEVEENKKIFEWFAVNRNWITIDFDHLYTVKYYKNDQVYYAFDADLYEAIRRLYKDAKR